MPSQLLDKLEVTSHPCAGQFEFIENELSHYETPELTSHPCAGQF